MAIKLDFTQESIVVVCDVCPSWRVIRFDRVAAWGAAADHERESHDGQKQATLAFGMAKMREMKEHLERQAARLSPYVES